MKYDSIGADVVLGTGDGPVTRDVVSLFFDASIVCHSCPERPEVRLPSGKGAAVHLNLATWEAIVARVAERLRACPK